VQQNRRPGYESTSYAHLIFDKGAKNIQWRIDKQNKQKTDNQNIQGTQKTKLPQSKWTNKEVGNWTTQNFFKGRSPNGQKSHEKMLTILGHKGKSASQKPH
jgi:hypothetical protein